MNLFSNPLRQILVLLVFCCLFLLHSPAALSQQFTYDSFPTNPTPGIQTNGGSANDAKAGVSGSLLQITPAAFSQVGSAWYANPNTTDGTLSLVNGFSTTFKFQFAHPAPNGGGSDGSADGIAFVVQNGSIDGTSGLNALAQNTGTGGKIGFTGLTQSFAIEFDTYYNGEYGDTLAAQGSPSTADQVSIMSCGSGQNTVNHNSGCQIATVDLSRLTSPIFLADQTVHTATVTFVPLGSCAINCNNLTVIVDNQTVLSATFDITSLKLDANQDAFVGFTGATGGGYQDQDIISWAFNVAQTGQPINVGTGANAVQTFDVVTGDNTNYIFTADYTNAQNTVTANGSSTPQITPLQISPFDWPKYVAGTPFATTACIPVNGSGGNCVGIRELCTTPTIMVPAGANCPQSSQANILFSVFVDPTVPYIPPTVFGTVEGNDNWTGGPCTFGTSVQNDPDFNKSCPQNGFGSVTGEGPYTHVTPAKTTNSTYYQVVGLLPPVTTPSGFANGYGWTNSASLVNATLTANPPALPKPNNNNMVLAPIDSITFVVLSPSDPAPSTTLPIQNSVTDFNPNNSNPIGQPGQTSCPNTITSSTPTGPFTAPESWNNRLAEGLHTLYYYTTDCAGTNERKFLFDGTSWSTTLNSINVNVDNTNPTLNCAAPDGNWHAGVVSLGCSASDALSGLATPVAEAPGAPYNFSLTTPTLAGVETSTATTNSVGGICDLATNCVTAGPLGPVKIDNKPPVITVTAPAATSYSANQKVKSNYGCVDGGSGVNTCNGTVGNGGYIDTKPTGITTAKSFVVNSTDNVGNASTQTVSYSISCHYVAFTVNPTTASRGSFVNLNTSIIDCSSSSQKLTLQFVLTSPQGKSCSMSSTNILTTPPITIPAGTSQSFGFPLLIPKNSCAGTYTFTTNTSIKGTQVDSTTVTLTVK